MNTYKIADSGTELIEFRANENGFALVRHIKKSLGHFDEYKTIILNKREALTLYQAIQEEILK